MLAAPALCLGAAPILPIFGLVDLRRVTFSRRDRFLFLGTLSGADSLMSMGSHSEAGFNVNFFGRPSCLVTCLN